MSRSAIAAAVCGVLLAAALSACQGPKQVNFPAGSTMDKLHRAGRVTIGVKSDQPGLGFRNPATGRYEGFDIEMAEIVAAALGLRTNQITYLETASRDRETFLKEGRVDFVVASYSITEDRRRQVGQAGPYYVTGQRLLVREEDKHWIDHPDDLSTDRVCSVTGSTSIRWAREKFGERLVEFTTYTDCVRQLLARKVRAVLTDGAVLLGYAAQQPSKLEVVAEPLSIERYGIGFRHGDEAFCRFLTDTITAAQNDGSWERAFAETLGKAGTPTPARPTPDACRS
ncbi:MAG TPA: glutamate ABC transporter substrate-binding protein [Micromonosporaceae bacterium]|nr:glutamate ABC transporter substrate-binding protein [Micromonosporaceae bacterium]